MPYQPTAGFLSGTLGQSTKPEPTGAPISLPRGKPIGKTNIDRWRMGGDDSSVANMAYRLDPQFAAYADQFLPRMEEMSPQLRQQLPSFLLNDHYKIKVQKQDEVTARMAEAATKPNVFGAMARSAYDSTLNPNNPESIVGFGKGIVEGVGRSVDNAASAMNEALTAAHGGIQDYRGPRLKETMGSPNTNPLQSVATVGGAMAGGAANALAEPLKPIVGEAVKGGVAVYENYPAVQQALQPIVQMAQGGSEQYNAWKLDHPSEAATLEGVLKIGSLPLAMQGAASTMNAGGKLVEGLGKSSLEMGKKAVAEGKNAVTAIRGAIPSKYSQQTKYLAEYYGTTPDKIISAIQKSGTKISPEYTLENIDDALGKAFKKDPAGYQTFIEKKLGDKVDVSSYAPTERARIDAESLLGTKGEQKILQSVQAQPTAKELQSLREKNPQQIKEPTLFTKGRVTESPSDLKLKEVAKGIEGYKANASPIARAKAVQKSLSEEYSGLIEGLKASDPALPPGEIAARIDAAKPLVMRGFANDETAKNAWDGVKNIWDDVSAKHPGTASGQLEARAAFYREVENQLGPGIWEKGNPRAVAVRGMGQVINKAVADSAPEIPTLLGGKVDVMKALDSVSNKYDLLRNLATQGGKSPLNSGVGKLLKNAWFRTGAGLVGGGAILKHEGLLP